MAERRQFAIDDVQISATGAERRYECEDFSRSQRARLRVVSCGVSTRIASLMSRMKPVRSGGEQGGERGAASLRL
jgi:hypothetical protein